jgi:sugar/nucleoside kinase (ribokinase family)
VQRAEGLLYAFLKCRSMHASNFCVLRQNAETSGSPPSPPRMEKARQMTAQVDLLAVNHEEAAAFAGEETDGCGDQQLLDACCEQASALNPAMTMVVSAGANGGHVLENGIWAHHRAIPMEPFQPLEPAKPCWPASLLGSPQGCR